MLVVWRQAWLSLLLLIVASLGCYAVTRRPQQLVTVNNTPNSETTAPLRHNLTVGQTVTAGPGTIGGISFYLGTQVTAPPDTSLILHVREPASNFDQRTVTTKLAASQTHLSRELSINLEHVLIDANVLTFRFEPFRLATTQQLVFILEAPDLSGTTPLPLAFEIDDTKYLGGTALYNNEQRERDLGFILYEQPILALTTWRWLSHPDHRFALFGVIFILASVLLHVAARYRTDQPTPSVDWQQAWSSWNTKRFWLAAAVLLLALFIAYYPALSSYFIQDDIQKLLRVVHGSDSPLRLLFGVERFELAKAPFVTPVAFWRPLTFSFVSWLLWHLFGLHATPYLLFTMLTFWGEAVALLALGWVLTRSRLVSFTATLLFLFHSSKISSLYWWSTTEDTVASLLIVLCLLLYTRWRATQTRRDFIWLHIVFALALLAKEHALLLMPLLVLIELFGNGFNAKQWRTILIKLRWLVLLVGCYLIMHTWILSQPTQPPYPQGDVSYRVSFAPSHLAQNTLPYAAWSVENWLWPRSAEPSWLAEYGRRWEAEPPYYPGLVLSAGIILVTLGAWYRKNYLFLKLTFFAMAWWLILLLPILALTGAWGSRWLSLATFGGSLVIATLWSNLWQKVNRRVGVALALVLLTAYGFYLARYHPTAIAYQELSAAAKTVATVGQLPPDIPETQSGTINPYLIELISHQAN